MPSITLDISTTSPLHTRILDAVSDRVKFSKRKFQGRHTKWRKAEEAALAFLPERDVDALKRAKREGGAPQYTTIVVPYTYGVLMASHTYWTTVFMSRAPVLQYSGRHGETEQATQGVEALMDYQMQVGEMLVPLYIWLLDVGKYGIGVIGDYWDEVESSVSEIREEEILIAGAVPTGKTKKIKTTRRVKSYAGNRLYNVRPYDFFPDARVPIHRFQQGEFCAVYNELGWNQVLRRKAQGFYVNTDKIKAGEGGFGNREQGSSQLELPGEGIDTSFFDKKTKDTVKIFECTIELIPNKWGLGKGDFPEKWVFTVTDDFDLVLGAQPLGMLHDKFPFQVLEYEPEGYSLVNRSIPEVLEPVQNTLDWLFNAHFYNVRKALNDQFVVDPSKIMMKDMLDPLPGGIIRLKPEAYDTDVRTALTQLQVVDVTQNHMRDMGIVKGVGQEATGVNEQIMGQAAPKGRTSATEIRTAATFGVNRLKTGAEFMSAMGFSPLAQMMLQNTQQFYDDDKKFKLVGDLALEAGPKFVDVTPDIIAGFWDFVPVDGVLPVDRFAQANLWREMLAGMVKFPQVLARYDVSRIFGWVAQLAGLKNINQFRIDVVPDAQAQQQAQQGNVVPIASGGPDSTRVPAGQVGQVGPTA
jgi:hypothetical protein